MSIGDSNDCITPPAATNMNSTRVVQDIPDLNHPSDDNKCLSNSGDSTNTSSEGSGAESDSLFDTDYCNVESEYDNCKSDTKLSIMQLNPTIEPQFKCKEENNKLPFPNFSSRWYTSEQKVYTTYNTARDAARASQPPERSSTNAIVCMRRSQVQGSLQSNLETLQKKLNNSCSAAKSIHYKALCDVPNYIKLKGPLVTTQEVGSACLLRI